MSDDKKDPKAADSEKIYLRVSGEPWDGSAIVHFRVKKDAPLRKLMQTYCKKMGLRLPAARFYFDNLPVNEENTPLSLEMEEGDTLDVYIKRTGGAPLTLFLNHF